MSNMWGKILDPGCRSCLTEEGAEGRKLLLAEADKDEEMAELIKRLFAQPGGPSMKILRSCDFLFFIYFFTFKVSSSVQHTFTFSLIEFKTFIALTVK